MLSPTEAPYSSKVFQGIGSTAKGVYLASCDTDGTLHVSIELIGEVTAKDDYVFLVSIRAFREVFVDLADLVVCGGGSDRLVGRFYVGTGTEAAMEDSDFL